MEVRTLSEGAKIKIPGVYDIPIEVYHSQCCDGPSISTSGIRKIVLQSPADFWMNSDLNPNRQDEKLNEALVLGRAAHHLLLGEKDFFKTFIVQPAELYDAKWNGNRKDCIAWLAEKRAEGLTVVTQTQIETIKGMAGVLEWQVGMTNCGLKNTDLIMTTGLLSGAVEMSMIWKDDGVWLKSRPDSIPADSDEVADLKTAADISDHKLSSTLLDRGYFIQGAMIGMGMKRTLARDMKGFHLVFPQKDAPYPISVRTLVEEDIILGEELTYMGIRIFKHCLATGIWPGPTAHEHDAQKLSLPQYGRDQLRRRLDRLNLEYAA